jgi:hypothetical protein
LLGIKGKTDIPSSDHRQESLKMSKMIACMGAGGICRGKSRYNSFPLECQYFYQQQATPINLLIETVWRRLRICCGIGRFSGFARWSAPLPCPDRETSKTADAKDMCCSILLLLKEKANTMQKYLLLLALKYRVV